MCGKLYNIYKYLHYGGEVFMPEAFEYKPEFYLLKDAFLGRKESLNKKLQYLASIAQPEHWDFESNNSGSYPILFNYLNFTYDRVRAEKKIKISVDNKAMCFNTGLQTIHGADIYAYFTEKRNCVDDDKQKWFLTAFTKDVDARMEKFDQLPEIADYFTNPSDFVFDKSLDISLDYDHIIDTNFTRFADIGLSDKHIILALLENAVMVVKKRISRNYKIAIPQFYTDKSSGISKIQLLLPLCMRTQDKADLALVVDKTEHRYIGKTILTLKWAYMNSRRIVKPDVDWLKI